MEDVGGLPLAQKGKRPRNQKEGPRKAGWEGRRSFRTETKMEVDLKMSLVSRRVFLPPCFLVPRSDTGCGLSRMASTDPRKIAEVVVLRKIVMDDDIW